MEFSKKRTICLTPTPLLLERAFIISLFKVLSFAKDLGEVKPPHVQ